MARKSVMDPTSQACKAGLDTVDADTNTAMGHVWPISATHTGVDQIATGVDNVRINLAAAGYRLSFQPPSQASQEYPDMAAHYATIHARLAPQGGTVQMLARIGYADLPQPSSRWPLDTRIVNA